MKKNILSLVTNITSKIDFIRVSSDDMVENPEKYIGYIVACDMISRKNGNKFVDISRYERLDIKMIETISRMYQFDNMLLFKDKNPKFNYKNLTRNIKSWKMVEFILHSKVFDKNFHGILVSRTEISTVMFECHEMDFFQKRSFDSLRIQNINPALKNFGLFMENFSKKEYIVRRIIE